MPCTTTRPSRRSLRPRYRVRSSAATALHQPASLLAILMLVAACLFAQTSLAAPSPPRPPPARGFHNVVGKRGSPAIARSALPGTALDDGDNEQQQQQQPSPTVVHGPSIPSPVSQAGGFVVASSSNTPSQGAASPVVVLNSGPIQVLTTTTVPVPDPPAVMDMPQSPPSPSPLVILGAPGQQAGQPQPPSIHITFTTVVVDGFPGLPSPPPAASWPQEQQEQPPPPPQTLPVQGSPVVQQATSGPGENTVEGQGSNENHQPPPENPPAALVPSTTTITESVQKTITKTLAYRVTTLSKTVTQMVTVTKTLTPPSSSSSSWSSSAAAATAPNGTMSSSTGSVSVAGLLGLSQASVATSNTAAFGASVNGTAAAEPAITAEAGDQGDRRDRGYRQEYRPAPL
ncbi:uncharacterized protein B0I36DRAFT_405877 [Microdochium trichocladiopsis]|uniref:Uncharacterized protein n=1 Tax=Microdochium trichocladiopsis TaxID=1682393 RepID=A0A9P8YCE3_9PEZI|nr:uncharacterized protein B0I36DRAFT_405877 [Microdochium trichocladiopsis]KAH7035330.1 hypothetical protein B0I36DRAFT_405877 [Microdochium trichocladiopsis]